MQNIYDNPDFFAAYSQLPRSIEGLAGAPEWPALRALLPELLGKSVVDLGCGFGWFCRFAREQRAAEVLGIDLSANMLTRAREMTADPAIAYRRADLETLELPESAFDLAFSSLALHYIVSLPQLLATVHRALRPGGSFVFSVEHPALTAPSRAQWVDIDGRKVWPLDQYQVQGPRTTDWLTKGVVKQHRTLTTYIGQLLRAGFALTHLEEWCPSEVQIAAHPDWASERDRPTFVLISARR